ncbi:hypothetical protein [Modestobacter roseus]|uniref:Uncharacterized protein n=1 Tax=Modestobacter roseus TaxID=1181884 RepID=A0A562INY7_9ACTN|nr:hypothetical protein [Modestobacter roseus]MQA35066.1 hypothetical protein [Modestobacter roseus]TWH72638.1 hypothetical protein JD78_01158 [Modestobacter roseus]
MSQPDRPRPVPGPPRGAPSGSSVAPTPGGRDGGTGESPARHDPAPTTPAAGPPFAGLAERPVAEHVGVYEAEHERLQRELSTIDQL